MGIFKPNYFYDKIWDIPVSFLIENDFKCVLLDVDNTLTTHDNPEPRPEIFAWLEKIKNAGIVPVVVSNNTEPRVAPFAERIGTKFVSHAKKPLSKGTKEAIKLTGVSKKQMLVIGDQIFTDILFGKWSGVKTVLVEPFELETMPFFKVKRFLESVVLGRKRG